jgi:hypothetical protein
MSRESRLFVSIAFSLFLIAGTVTLAGTEVIAQCPAPQLISGLQVPLGITRSEKGNLFVSESGTVLPNTGRISIVDPDGNRRTLLDGLPSGINDVNEISGPAGIFIHEHTLYVLIGIGDAIDPGPFPGTAVPNPSPASPLFSSVLAIHFSNSVERRTTGFTLTSADHQALASGERVRKSNGGSDRITIELIANFPDFFAEPSATVPNNVRGSNPFDLVLVEGHRRHHGDRRDDDDDDDNDHDKNELLYVTDGGRNLVWRVDIDSGGFSILAVFPQVANTFPLPNFPPFIDAVPTGIAESRGQLLVTLFSGAPFPPGASVVAQVDPLTGNPTPFITGLKTAIDVLPIRKRRDTDHLVLQHASAGPFFGSPGLLLRFETPSGPPAVLSNCLTRPTSMTLDRETGTLYVTELVPVPPGQTVVLGRIVTVHLVP